MWRSEAAPTSRGEPLCRPEACARKEIITEYRLKALSWAFLGTRRFIALNETRDSVMARDFRFRALLLVGIEVFLSVLSTRFRLAH